MIRKEQIELAKEWEALGQRMRILKDELEKLGLRQAEIEYAFASEMEGTTLYRVLDDEEEGPELSAVIHELAQKYPGTVDYEAKAEPQGGGPVSLRGIELEGDEDDVDNVGDKDNPA